MNLPNAVQIVEVGPRDGLQNEPNLVPTAEKLQWLEALAFAGIRRFEATFFVSPRRIPHLADAADVLAEARHHHRARYGGLIPNERG